MSFTYHSRFLRRRCEEKVEITSEWGGCEEWVRSSKEKQWGTTALGGIEEAWLRRWRWDNWSKSMPNSCRSYCLPPSLTTVFLRSCDQLWVVTMACPTTGHCKIFLRPKRTMHKLFPLCIVSWNKYCNVFPSLLLLLNFNHSLQVDQDK